jgi:hypothetical protein
MVIAMPFELAHRKWIQIQHPTLQLRLLHTPDCLETEVSGFRVERENGANFRSAGFAGTASKRHSRGAASVVRRSAVVFAVSFVEQKAAIDAFAGLRQVFVRPAPSGDYLVDDGCRQILQ